MGKIDLNRPVRDYIPTEQNISLLAYFTRPDNVLKLMNLSPDLLNNTLLNSTDTQLRQMWFVLNPTIPLTTNPQQHYIRTPAILPTSDPLTPVEYVALSLNRRLKVLRGRMEHLTEQEGRDYSAVAYQDLKSRIQEIRRTLEIISFTNEK